MVKEGITDHLYTQCPYCKSWNEHKVQVYAAASAPSKIDPEPTPAQADEPYILVCLFGFSGVGKEDLVQHLLSKHPDIFNRVTEYTTETEYNGNPYLKHLDGEGFAAELWRDNIIEVREIDNVLYGIKKDSLVKDKINLCILPTASINNILDNYADEIELYPILIIDTEKNILLSQLQGVYPDCYKICQKFLQDCKEYNDIEDFEFDTYYNGNKIDPEYLYQNLKDWIGF